MPRYGIRGIALGMAAAAALGGLAAAGSGTTAASAGTAVRGPVLGRADGAFPGGAGFTDTFATAVDDAPGYGLNDSLAARQPGGGGVTYTRESGVWYQAPAP
jgi:hypothetical protein